MNAQETGFGGVIEGKRQAREIVAGSQLSILCMIEYFLPCQNCRLGSGLHIAAMMHADDPQAGLENGLV